jgi:hypothetical protein
MTSEPDSTSRRRPPTIDLTATEVETQTPEQQAEQGNDKTRGGLNFDARLVAPAFAAIAGAVLTAALGVGLWLAGIIPPQSAPAPSVTRGPSNNAVIAAINARLDKIETALRTPQAASGLATRMSSVEAQLKSLNDSLAALNRRVDDVAVTAKDALAHADAATTAAHDAATAASAAKGSAQTGVQRSDLDALAARIAALENSIKTLSAATASRPASAQDRAARAAVAAEALRAVVERGAPYQAEVAAMKSLGADQNALAALEPFAESGVPTDAELAHELSQLMASLRQAPSAPASRGTFLGRLEDSAKNLVHVTPVNAPPSDGSSSIVAKLDADAAGADITAALADIARLPQSAASRFEPWVHKANERTAAIAASRRIAGDALAALTNTNSQ